MAEEKERTHRKQSENNNKKNKDQVLQICL